MLRPVIVLCIALVGTGCSDPMEGDVGLPAEAFVSGTVLDAGGEPVEGAQVRGRHRLDVCGSNAARTGLIDWTVTDAAGRFEYLISQPLVRPFTGCVLIEVEAPASLGLPTKVLEDLTVDFRLADVPPDTLRVEVVFD